MRPVELIVGVGGSLAVLASCWRPWWEAAAIVLATLLPAGLVLYGATAAPAPRLPRRRRSSCSVSARSWHARRTSLAGRQELQGRLSELVALNEIAEAVSSTLDLEEATRPCPPSSTACRSIGRSSCSSTSRPASSPMGGASAEAPSAIPLVGTDPPLPSTTRRPTLVQLARAHGPLFLRDIDQDPHEPNRVFARALEVTSSSARRS